MLRRIRIVTTAFLLLAAARGAVVAAGQESAKPQTPAQKNYAESDRGLRLLTEDLLSLAKQNDQAALLIATQNLELPDSEAWFKSAFDPPLGQALAEGYRRERGQLASGLANLLLSAVSEKWTSVRVRRVDKTCERDSLEVESPIIFASHHRVPLYEVRLMQSGGSQGWAVWFFTYAAGGFRYLSQLEIPKQRTEVRPGAAAFAHSNVPLRQAKILEQTAPLYPQNARAAHVEGLVRLRGVIGTDGRVKELTLISGHCMLVESAVAAVRNWRYEPTLIDGQPVEVETTIDVVFKLSL